MIKFDLKVMFLIVFLLGISSTAIAQNTDELSIVRVDSTWGKEIIEFPIDWASKLTIEGYEELRFAPNWADKTSEEFWTLVMSWNVKTETELPLYELQFNFTHYFDGLMKPNHWANEFPEPKVEFFEPETTENGFIFKGKMFFFDGFHTGKLTPVYILGQQEHCDTTRKSIIIFKISSKAYTERVWEKLNSINIKEDLCNF
eukprot:TRINITY_DN5298_c0_g2_i2.p1 TRINITY_DN5298_c0_g2~~TRINITY_DN5298_c0_g2_i2.p1  ORF type:complete len:201 (+),score=34.02 TRINITY_DN5298_c0_g2_i2:496-1098(+)